MFYLTFLQTNIAFLNQLIFWKPLLKRPIGGQQQRNNVVTQIHFSNDMTEYFQENVLNDLQPFNFQHHTANSSFLLLHIVYSRDGENFLLYSHDFSY